MIQHRKTGQFSGGGIWGQFSTWVRSAKVWRSLRNLNLHLSQFIEYQYQKGLIKKLPETYYDCDVVEYEMVEISRKSLTDYFDSEVFQKKIKRGQKNREIQLQRELNEKKKQYNKLKKELGEE